MPKGFFVVRRGSKQAVYRTYSYDEAVVVANEWLKDKTIHRWDNSYSSSIKATLESLSFK
jgi:hypothetical protein